MMDINVDNLKFFQSERMTDNSDGGGRMTSTEIISGVKNSIFDDISDIDRAAGDVSIRKVYAAVDSNNTGKYLDAGVCIIKEPVDPNVNVLLFSTGSFYDEHSDLVNKVEQTISRGARWNGWLWGNHFVGQRAIVAWQRPENELIPVGSRLELVSKSNNVEVNSQFLWITKVTNTLRNAYDEKGVYSIRELVCEISEPLNYDFVGPEPSRIDPSAVSATAILFSTRYNQNSVELSGMKSITKNSNINDFSVYVDSLYSYIIPTSLNETALPDVNPGGNSIALVDGNSSNVSFSTTLACIKPNTSLYLGSGAKPGSISISVSGSTITDLNGVAILSGSEIGTIDYGNGVISWNPSCPNYATNNKAVSFIPAAKPLKVSDTASLSVTAENRGYVWTITITPVPTPKSLKASYKVNNQWYELFETGSGNLVGTDSSYGSGVINFQTGTVVITTGELPDVDSKIIFTWTNNVNYTNAGGTVVQLPALQGIVTGIPVVPGNFSISWTVGNTTYTLSDNGSGVLTGTGGSGLIRNATGEWLIHTTALPPSGTTFTINYQYGTQITETKKATVSGNPFEALIPLANTGILAGSVDVEFSAIQSGAVILRDAGNGTFSGKIGGTIAYDTGTIILNASRTVPYTNTWNVWGWVSAGTYTVPPNTLYTDATGTHQPGEVIPQRKWTITGQESYSGSYQAAEIVNDNTEFTIHYRISSSSSTIIGAISTPDVLVFNIPLNVNQRIVPGSLRFRIGSTVYTCIGTQVYRDFSADTGIGTLAGTIDPSSGVVTLTTWPSGATSIVIDSLVLINNQQLITSTIFRTVIGNIKPGTIQVRYITESGSNKSKTVDSTGVLEDTDCKIIVDVVSGIVDIAFGSWEIDGNLTQQDKAESWYDSGNIVNIGGVNKIWKPITIFADSIVYNAVAQTVLPPDSRLLGINAARLPVDGKGLIFSKGRLVLVHNTQVVSENSLSPTQVIDCGRVRIYRVIIEDVNGKRLAPSQYTVDRVAGTVTMSPSLSLTGFTGPYSVKHTIADLARLVDVDINGRVTINKPLSHAYPKDTSFVSGVLYVGTMQARVTNLFAQSTFDNVWQDTLRGSAPLAQYNDIQYPLIVTNQNAYQDRFMCKFTSSTAYQVIGENLGGIGTGTINADCSPINPLTGYPYFTIKYQGWGSNWSTGNILRFNVIGANYPIDLIRPVQPSEPTGQDIDKVELLFFGNVDSE